MQRANANPVNLVSIEFSTTSGFVSVELGRQSTITWDRTHWAAMADLLRGYELKENAQGHTNTRISHTLTLPETDPARIHDWLCRLLEPWQTERTYEYSVEGHPDSLYFEYNADPRLLTITANPPDLLMTAETLDQKLRQLRLCAIVQVQQTCVVVELSDGASKNPLQTFHTLAGLYLPAQYKE